MPTLTVKPRNETYLGIFQSLPSLLHPRLVYRCSCEKFLALAEQFPQSRKVIAVTQIFEVLRWIFYCQL